MPGPLLNYPLLVFLVSFLVLSAAARIGATRLARMRKLEQDVREDYGFVVGATLTLLGLIIGFSFSMAISRYDQRKNLEEAEASAIGTEYVRADLLPAADGARVRALLKRYLEQRILFYSARDESEIAAIDARVAQLHDQLWAAVVAPASANPTPTVAMAVSGMNDVLNAQGYAQAAASNRIPTAAWTLLLAIAVCANLLVGYGTRNVNAERVLLLVLPAVVSVSFFLIADIDTPRGGVIRVGPQNLQSLSEALGPR